MLDSFAVKVYIILCSRVKFSVQYFMEWERHSQTKTPNLTLCKFKSLDCQYGQVLFQIKEFEKQ